MTSGQTDPEAAGKRGLPELPQSETGRSSGLGADPRLGLLRMDLAAEAERIRRLQLASMLLLIPAAVVSSVAGIYVLFMLGIGGSIFTLISALLLQLMIFIYCAVQLNKSGSSFSKALGRTEKLFQMRPALLGMIADGTAHAQIEDYLQTPAFSPLDKLAAPKDLRNSLIYLGHTNLLIGHLPELDSSHRGKGRQALWGYLAEPISQWSDGVWVGIAFAAVLSGPLGTLGVLILNIAGPQMAASRGAACALIDALRGEAPPF